MEYKNLINEMRTRFRELNELYINDSKEMCIYDSTGTYVVVGVLFMPYIIDKIQKNDDNGFLSRIFSFFEEMAMSNNEEVREVLMYTVLEDLGDNEEVYNKAVPYMGSNTKELCSKVDRFLGRR